MKNRYVVSALLIILLVVHLEDHCLAQSANDYKVKIQQIEEFISKKMELDKIPGLSVGFYIGDFEWAKGFGYADLENNLPATANSSYRLASNTKSMTAIAVIQLAEKGKIDLDADIRNYLPYFPRKKWPFSTRQLMGHLAGISHYQDYENEGHIKVHKDTRESIDIFDDFDLISEPGTQYLYSSYGYNLLGAIVETVAKKPFEDYLESHIWDPLGMERTCMDSPTEIIPNRVTGYRMQHGNLEQSEYVDMSSRFAAGGTRSTVVDLLKYARGVREMGIISQESITMMETSMQTQAGYFTGYGMGWRLTPTNGHFIAMHTGSQQETRTILIRIPEEDAAIAMAFNLEGTNQGSYAYHLYQILFEEPWNIPTYTSNRMKDAQFQAIWTIYNYGLGYYDRNHRQNCNTMDIIASAFAYFNGAINTDSLVNSYPESMARINNGRHPVANEAFIDIGSYMANNLLIDNPTLNYHQKGAINFFYDYIRKYKEDTAISNRFRFPPEFENLIMEWQSDWKRIWSPDIRTFKLTAWSDPADEAKNLKQLISKAEIYPDFLDDFIETVFYLVQTDQFMKANEVAVLAQEIYPRYRQPYILGAYVHLMKGELEKARIMILYAKEYESDRNALHARTLTSLAGRLMANNHLDEAIELLHISGELFPEEASIPEFLGEIYLEKSRRYFMKALQLDPAREGSWNQLKKIK